MKTIPNDKTLSGAIVLERGTGFLSKQIMMHMAILARMRGVKPLKFSHAETLIWNEIDQQLYTVGARGKGTEISRVGDYYSKHEILILRPRKPLAYWETTDMWIYFDKVDPSTYQVGNFLAWITYLKTFIWISGKGDAKNYCYELAARFANVTGRWHKDRPLDRVSVYDLYENPNYEPMEE